MEINERVAKLEQENKGQNYSIVELKKVIIEIRKEINEIKEKLLGRPSWLVMLIISTLLTVCTFLGTITLMER